MRTIVFHGTADRTVHPRNAQDRVAAATPDADTQEHQETVSPESGRPHTVSITTGADGSSLSELWLIEGSGHAWSGGSPEGSYTDPSGPNASAEMVRFLLQTDQPAPRLPFQEAGTTVERTAAV
jgi:poly(3-hydroxybutyrate) depolymerase